MAVKGELLYGDLTEKIRQCAFEVHLQLGHGFLEKVYENALYHLLNKNLIACKQQFGLKVYFDKCIVGEYFADIVVQDKIVIELKTVDYLSPVHFAQLKHYLKATQMKLGLLINFGSRKLEFKRVIL